MINGFDWEDGGRAMHPGTYDVRLVTMSGDLWMARTLRYYVTDESGRIREADYRPFGTVSTLPEDTTEIHAQAFAGTQLTEISIPASFTSIAEDAFDGTGLLAIHTNSSDISGTA